MTKYELLHSMMAIDLPFTHFMREQNEAGCQLKFESVVTKRMIKWQA